MSARHCPAAMGLLLLAAACADPDAAARIEIRKTNAITAIEALQDTYCSLSATTRARLRDAGEISAETDSCTDQTEENNQ